MYDLLKIAPVVISAIALIISTGGLVYTIRTFSVSHRPFLGVTDSVFQLIENPPRAIVWKFIVKNAGTKPAVLKTEENRATLTTARGVSTLPFLGAIGETVSYVMPSQTLELLGQYSEVNGSVRMEEILNGSVVLDMYLKLSYSGEAAIGRKKYYYSTQIRFHTAKGVAPGLSTVKAEGN
jgi:hypothetical protein